MCDFCHHFIPQFHCHLLHRTYHNGKSRPPFPRNLGENACAQSVVVSSVCVRHSTAWCPTSLHSQSLCSCRVFLFIPSCTSLCAATWYSATTTLTFSLTHI